MGSCPGGLELTQYNVSVKDGGQLNINGKPNGVTQDLLSEVQKVSAHMGKSKKDEQVGALALLGLAQQASIGAMTVRYDDNSFVNRLFEFVSKLNHQPRTQIVSELKAVLPLLASQLQNPRFADKAVKEISAFLDNPKSLELSASPEKPDSFAIIATAAATLPQKLIDILNIKVAANQQNKDSE